MKLIYNFTTTEDYSSIDCLQNRAFQYGDGLFETMVFRDGQLRFLPDHFTRLQKGVQALAMELPGNFSPGYLQDAIPALARMNNLPANARVKIQVWRQPGGLYTPTSQETHFMISCSPLREDWFSVKNKAILFEDVRKSYSSISAFKTCSALPYVLAGIARKKAGADDAILLDTSGNLCECIASNLFWWNGDEEKLLTPSLLTGCINGIMRTQILRRAAQSGIETVEVENPLLALRFANIVFASNVVGIQYFNQIGEVFFQTGTIPARLQQLLQSLQYE